MVYLIKLLNKHDPIAVVGASNNREKYGYKIFNDLKEAGYNVFPINVNEDKIMGNKAFHSLDELISSGIKPLIVNLVVPPQVSRKIVDDCKRLGITNIWFQPGSFDKKVIEYASKLELNIEYKECIMVARRKG